MEHIHNDGGRGTSKFKGTTGDCATRAIAIATGMDYEETYNLVNEFCKKEKPSKRRRGISSARTGVHKITFQKIMDALGFEWTATMQIGSGCNVHMKKDELPSGVLIVNLSKHFACVIDGVLHDTYDCSRDGTRCVYGYWKKP